jgi:hypothetical protein
VLPAADYVPHRAESKRHMRLRLFGLWRAGCDDGWKVNVFKVLGCGRSGGRLVWGAEMQAGAVGWEAGICTTTASSRVCVLSLFLLNVK